MSKKQRRKGYSFEKGDDEILPVKAFKWHAETDDAISNARSGDKAATVIPKTERFLSVMSGQMVSPHDGSLERGFPAASPPSRRFGSGLMSHSTSTSTVKWVGDGENGIDEKVVGGTDGMEGGHKRETHDTC
jgi:hypothetical protein